MTARRPRFEIVRSDAGWFARFVAANGQKVWQTEVYTRRSKALRAVEILTGTSAWFSPMSDSIVISHGPCGYTVLIREVDERTAP